MKYNYNLAPTRKKVNCHSLTKSVETKINEMEWESCYVYMALMTTWDNIKTIWKKINKSHFIQILLHRTGAFASASNFQIKDCWTVFMSRPNQIYLFLSKCLLTSLQFISCIYKSLLVRLCGKISICNVWRVITFMLSCFGYDLRLAWSGDRDIILPLIEGIYSDYV